MILCTSASGGVHTGLFKCTVKCIWSALETSLCVRVLFHLTDLDFFCHRNFKTSRCRSALSSEVKMFLATELIQSKRQKVIIKVSITSSHKFHSRKRESIFEWGLLISTKCRWVFLSSDSWASSESSRFPFYCQYFLLYFIRNTSFTENWTGAPKSVFGKYLFGRRFEI